MATLELLGLGFVSLVWIAQWLDWQAGLEHPSLRIRVSHNG
jgi:hypothetical protein